MKTNKNKTSDSKKKYGTMTASADANNDYTSSTGSNSATSSITSESMSEYGTMTALEDSNKDYKQNSQSSQKSSTPNQGSLTSSYDSNQQS